MAKLHQACKALHTSTFLGVSAKFTTATFTTRKSRGLREISHSEICHREFDLAQIPTAKFTTTNLTWREILPPPLYAPQRIGQSKTTQILHPVEVCCPILKGQTRRYNHKHHTCPPNFRVEETHIITPVTCIHAG